MPRPKKSNRNDGRYEIKRTIGHDPNGKGIVKSFYGASKEEALEKYRKYRVREAAVCWEVDLLSFSYSHLPARICFFAGIMISYQKGVV